MKRFVDKHLQEWATSDYRKSLLLRGARQVGKTYAIRNLGKTFESYVEINFELTPDAAALFDKDLDANRLIRDLSLFCGKRIEPGKTLLFFDEVQVAPRVVTALRYFYEMTPALHVVAAGSHLGFAFDEVGVPVGRVSMLQMRPLSFLEFLCASGENLLAREILNHDSHQPFFEALHNKALDLLGQYLAVGGMPQTVRAWIEEENLDVCRRINLDIVLSYRQDLEKYGAKFQQRYLGVVFDSLPRQMGCKFRYQAIHGEYRKSQLSPALDLLIKINVATKVVHSSAQGVPLAGMANYDRFKMLLVDVALSQAMLGVPGGDWILKSKDTLENKGEITEAFVGQELLAYQNSETIEQLYYWHRETPSSNAEVDYVVQQGSTVIPIEVKSGTSGWLRSMHKFLDEHPASPYGVRFHAGNHHVDGKIKSFPLYAVAGAVGVNMEAALYVIGS